jgi:lysophospholipase L1-like esterase
MILRLKFASRWLRQSLVAALCCLVAATAAAALPAPLAAKHRSMPGMLARTWEAAPQAQTRFHLLTRPESVYQSQAEQPTAAARPTVQAARMVVLGDSVSAGVGASTPFLSYASLLYRNENRTYPHDQGADLRSVLGADLQYINVAHSGDTTEMVVDNQLPRLHADPQEDPASLGTQPLHGHTVVVMTIGGNDVRRQLGPGGDPAGTAYEDALENLRRIVAYFGDTQRFVDGATVYLGSVYDITDGSDSAHLCLVGLRFTGVSEAMKKWHTGYTALAQELNAAPGAHPTVVPIDVYGAFLGHGFHYADTDNAHFDPHDPTLWMNEQDCIHPNNRGHHELRRLFFRAITGRSI